MSTSSSRRSGAWLRTMHLLPFAIALGFGYAMLARREFFLIDDAYISFRYAINFAQGHGLVWNIGVPVEGYTCLLWVLLLSGMAKLGIDLTYAAVGLSVLFGLGCLDLLRRIARSARSGEERSSWESVPGLLLASLPSFAHAMTSGMEETCFAYVSLLGIHWLILGREQPRLRILAGVAFAAAALTRPEGVLVAAVAVLTEWMGLAGQRVRWTELILPSACVACVVAIQTLIRLQYYGYLLPNTFYAKVIFGRVTIERGAAHLAGFALSGGWLLLIGFPRAGFNPKLLPWIAHGYALAVSYSAYLLIVGGDHPHWFRFYIPLLPFALLGTAQRLRLWMARAPAPLTQPAWRHVVLCVAFFPGLAACSFPFSEAYEPVVGYIDAPLKKLMVDIDRFFDEIPQDSFCAVAAIGYVGYRHLGLHILDTWGLTDAHIAHVQAAPVVKFGHDKQDIAYVASMKPDYIYVFAPSPAPPLLGYDTCWPSEDPPAAVYRRSLPLASDERSLGVPQPSRRLAPPPACHPPVYAP